MKKTDLTRRSFAKIASAGAVFSIISSRETAAASQQNPIRLGGPVFAKYKSPEEWVKAVKALGYSAAYCPVGHTASDDTVKAYEKAAKENGIIIAETGAWSNPISPNKEERKKAFQKCINQLDLADRIGARCCVNISGSRGDKWSGHHPKNLTRETFDMIVETTRKIIDEVKPKRSFFALETMPWSYPDSPESYFRLFKAIDREQFGVHMDPVNLVNSPQRYYSNAKLIKECFANLGPHIKSCHAKDIILRQQLTTHLDEIRPGEGGLDYKMFLQELSQLKDVPLMLEHLPNAEEYKKAADHIRSFGKQHGFRFA